MLSLWIKYVSELSIPIRIYITIFSILFCLETIGKKFGFRKLYILILNKIFNFAASKENAKTLFEENEEKEKEYEVIISPVAPKVKLNQNTNGHFKLEDSIPYITVGMQAIVNDVLNKSLTPAELSAWNMLSRTKKKHKASSSKSLTFLWLLGFFVRYFLLFPVRALILILSVIFMVLSTLFVGCLPNGPFKMGINELVLKKSFSFVSSALSVVTRFHNKENKPRNGIVVANHTSPIDAMVLATDNCYDMVGQRTEGFLGVFMKALSNASPSHIWFERGCGMERSETLQRMLSHSQNSSLPPLLIFPEGGCVNNTSVLLFRKGVFTLDVEISPIAIKFDHRYGDAFWQKNSFLNYCLNLMTSWAFVVDVWYLPSMRRGSGESPERFAGRVKSAIAKTGGFFEAEWDCFVSSSLKKQDVKVVKERSWLKRQQREFARHLQEQESATM